MTSWARVLGRLAFYGLLVGGLAVLVWLSVLASASLPGGGG